MQKNLKASEIRREVAAYFHGLSYADSTMAAYHASWNRLEVFMERTEEPYLTTIVVDAFAQDVLGGRDYDAITRYERNIIRNASILIEYVETGSIKFRSPKLSKNFYGLWGKLIIEYIAYKQSYGLTLNTINEYKYHLNQFQEYAYRNDINTRNITSRTIINYSSSLGFATGNVRYRNLSVLKGFLRYLYDKEVLLLDLSQAVPKVKNIRQPKLPSVYSKDEIARLIQAIERSSPKGKRDYAMVLLAARLGLRSSDICGLTFGNILWERNLFTIVQNKTGNRIDLPILADVGEAIIDYLKYARPHSSEPYVFLHVMSPYSRLSYPTLHSIISLYMRRTGISYEGTRKRGPHALRHSLAGILLEKKTPVPIISEVLGHQSTESTRYYLKIDIQSLRQCALEVPPINSGFYGGQRYE